MENNLSTDERSPLCGIVVLNYNNWEDSIECVESLLKLNYECFRIVIVDNCSTNDSMRHLITWIKNISQSCNITYANINEKEIDKRPNDIPPKITLIKSENNGGYAAGNNIGINHLLIDDDCEYIWILNNDTVVPTSILNDSINSIQNNIRKDLKIGIFGHKMLYYHNPEITQASYYNYNSWFGLSSKVIINNEDEIYLNPVNSYLSGASMLLKKSFIKEVGLLSCDYFLYYEEPDICIRASKLGYSLVILNSLKVLHKEGGSAGSDNDGRKRSSTSDKFLLRSRMIITSKFYKKRLIVVKLGLLISLFNRLRRKQFNNSIYVVKLILSNDYKTVK